MVKPMIYTIKEAEELLDSLGIPANLSLEYRIKKLVEVKDAKIEAQGERIKAFRKKLRALTNVLGAIVIAIEEGKNETAIKELAKHGETLGEEALEDTNE
jgi:hypothetical protein